MPVKVLSGGRDALKGGGGGSEWGTFIRLAKDGLTLEFVYLDDLSDDIPDDHKIVQYHEYAWVPGETNGKEFNINFPVFEEDPPEMKEMKTRYQYASNILIIKAFKTDDRRECELDGSAASTEWKDRPVADRVKILAQGRDTSNTFLGHLEDWSDEGKGAPGHLMRLERTNDGNRTKYELRFVKDVKLAKATIEEADASRHNIMELLDDKHEFGMRHTGYAKKGEQPAADDIITPSNAESLEMEGEGVSEKDIFDDVNADGIRPDASSDFVG